MCTATDRFINSTEHSGGPLYTRIRTGSHPGLNGSTNKEQYRKKQETQLSLTNRATHLCKCNDVVDLTSVIKIRLKKIDSSHPAFQGHSRSLEPIRIGDFLLVFSSNFVPKTRRFRDIQLQKCCDLEIRVRVRQGHWTRHYSIERM